MKTLTVKVPDNLDEKDAKGLPIHINTSSIVS